MMFRDKDYVVKDDEVLIVDEFTGRIMPGRRYSDGLHQAIEAKEHVNVRRESRTLATITFQNFFNKFRKKAGMTGTAQTEEREFRNIYGMDVIVIPTNRPVIRKDLEDAVYKTKKEKFHAVVEEIVKALSLIHISLRLYRESKGKRAYAIIEVDTNVSNQVVSALKGVESVTNVLVVPAIQLD